MTQNLIMIGIGVVGMILGFVYYMLKKIDKNMEKLFDANENIIRLVNDLDKRIIVLETKAKERRHDFMEETANG